MGATDTRKIANIAMLGNYAPRRCGIATFTTDLSDALVAACPEIGCAVIAMNEPGKRYAYPARVQCEIAQSDLTSYQRAADFLNLSAADVLCVQHEYGIFGGKAGAYLLRLLRELRMPIVSVLHTLLPEPDSAQRAVMEELTQLSERLVVMSSHGEQLLHELYGVPRAKIDLLPHGIPDVPATAHAKRQLGVEAVPVILTFGLLSPDKGIENMIDAMPAILKQQPEAIYIVLGATHPHVKEQQGEAYRQSLELRALQLGVQGSMIFHDRFVSRAELTDYLSAADIYVTPYLKLEQSTSGTLAYALGSGKAVVSTPYWYARELLADGHGVLVPRHDPPALAEAVIELLGDDEKRRAICERARARGLDMRWPAVARGYHASFERARAEHEARTRESFRARTLAQRPLDLPEVRLEHLQLMTDSTGLMQHAVINVPRYEDGYCLDDNARALLLIAMLEEARAEDPKTLSYLAARYLAFMHHSFQEGRGRFRNFMTFSRRFSEGAGSEDCHGRGLWALGGAAGRLTDRGRRTLCKDLFLAALPATLDFTSPRAWAYALLGVHEYLRGAERHDQVESVGSALAEKLWGIFAHTSAPDWPWFENSLTYANPRLSQALLMSGVAMKNQAMVDAGLRSLDWLLGLQRSREGHFAPIGSAGFYVRGGVKATHDQQPIEACAMVSACLEAERVTGEARWMHGASRAFLWFLGYNELRQSLYVSATGGCRDGLHHDRVNENQGAESTLSFLLALTEMRSALRTSRATGDDTHVVEARASVREQSITGRAFAREQRNRETSS
jgi:glycosyltransferase involved in cell wall biosynthesis